MITSKLIVVASSFVTEADVEGFNALGLEAELSCENRSAVLVRGGAPDEEIRKVFIRPVRIENYSSDIRPLA